MKKRYFILISALILQTLSACGSREDARIRDAMRFCAVFSPESLAEMRTRFQGELFRKELIFRVEQAVTTPGFSAILNKQHELPQDAQALYDYYVDEVSSLIGYRYSCPDLQAYFRETLGDSEVEM